MTPEEAGRDLARARLTPLTAEQIEAAARILATLEPR